MGYFLAASRADMPDPAVVFARLLALPEHAHFAEAEARVEFLMRGHEEIRAGHRVLGTVFRPDVQGRLSDVFKWLLDEKFGCAEGERIDFLVVLDAQFWLDAGDVDREILVYHEMQHMQPAFDKFGAQRFCRETGLPVLALVGHDVEEFAAVARRYGAHSQELNDFVHAISEGDARHR